MKIGYFISHFPYPELVDDPRYLKKYAHGGTEIAAYNLACEMLSRGHKVEIFTTSKDQKEEIEYYPNMRIHRFPTNLKISSANISYKLWTGPFKADVDIVHAHYNLPYSDYSALKFSREKNVPLVVTYHADAQESGGNMLRNLATFLYNRILLPRVLDHANIIIATTPRFVEESKFLRSYKKKIKIIPNGINIQEYDLDLSQKECRIRLKLPEDKLIILFFGNLVRYKGPDILLKAFAQVRKKYSKTLLFYAGRGDMESELKRKVSEMKLEDSVCFSGYVPEELKPLYYKAADIFCLPSRTLAEAFGIVNLEAMASGLPIIASKLGGIPDVVQDEETGLLVTPGSVDRLKDAIIKLIENKDLRYKLGKKGRKKVQRYSWENIARETERIYEELLS